MSVKAENLEKNMVKLTIEVAPEELDKAIQAAYMKQRSKISVPGFRKGKVPRQMIEKMYGVEIFFEDAANELINEEYPKAATESGLDIVSRPVIDIEQMEKDKPFIFTAEVAVKPEVTLGTYKGIEVEKADATVTEEEVAEAIDKERDSNARTISVEDGELAEGDIAVIDFEGFVDGVAFDGGKGENYDLTIGSHTFIDTFEDQLVGKKVGDEVEVQVTFPEEYQEESLAGKAATFQVKVNEIKRKELPELDDEFAQDVSEFDTLEEYKDSVKAKLQEKKEADAKAKQEEEALTKLGEEATMEIPEAMIDFKVENMMSDFANRFAQQGISMEMYMQFTGMTKEKLQEQMRPEAVKSIQVSLALEAVAKAENIEATDEDVEAEIKKMAEMYGMEADKLMEYMGEEEKENMKKDLAVQKAVEFVMANVKEK